MARYEVCEICPLSKGGEEIECQQLVVAGYCGNWVMGEAPGLKMGIYSRESNLPQAPQAHSKIEDVNVSAEYL